MIANVYVGAVLKIQSPIANDFFLAELAESLPENIKNDICKEAGLGGVNDLVLVDKTDDGEREEINDYVREVLCMRNYGGNFYFNKDYIIPNLDYFDLKNSNILEWDDEISHIIYDESNLESSKKELELKTKWLIDILKNHFGDDMVTVCFGAFVHDKEIA